MNENSVGEWLANACKVDEGGMMAGKDNYTAGQFIDAIPGTAGIVTQIAAKVGCAWHTAKKYIDKHPTVLEAYNSECEKVLDAAESVVIQKITDADEQMAKWYLTMKGGRRGYAPKASIKHTGDGPDGEVVVTFKGNVDASKL